MLNPFQYALTREPASNAGLGITTSQHLGVPNVDLMMEQYESYLHALRQCGLQVMTLPCDERFPDGHFVEDPVIIFHDVLFVSRLGAISRRGEADAIASRLTNLRQIQMTGDMASLDGGDVLVCKDRVLIGISERTNVAGAIQLENALRTIIPDLIVEHVHFTGVLHLKTGMTELAPGVIVKSPLMQTNHDLSFAKIVMLSDEEAYAADVLPINDKLIVPAGFPKVAELARQYYDDIFMLDMSEFEKMDGGVTCLSLRY